MVITIAKIHKFRRSEEPQPVKSGIRMARVGGSLPRAAPRIVLWFSVFSIYPINIP